MKDFNCYCVTPGCLPATKLSCTEHLTKGQAVVSKNITTKTRKKFASAVINSRNVSNNIAINPNRGQSHAMGNHFVT